jgi:hypothetical protein
MVNTEEEDFKVGLREGEREVGLREGEREVGLREGDRETGKELRACPMLRAIADRETQTLIKK